MKPELVQAFLLQNGDRFEMMTMPDIQDKLLAIDDSKAALFMGLDLQNPTVILVIAILLGWDRFFLGDIGLGILKVLTCYGFGIWWLIDIFTAQKRTREHNYKKFTKAVLISR